MKRQLMKRLSAVALAAVITTSLMPALGQNPSVPGGAITAKAETIQASESVSKGTTESGRSSFAKKTMDEIRDLYASIPYVTALYKTAPVISGTDYAPAVLSDVAKENVLAWINYYRTVAGLQTVALSDEGNLAASYGALCMAMNNQLAHYPSQPADMGDSDYQTAYSATSSSNISYSSGYAEAWVLETAVSGQIRDSSPSNIGTLGHRRWLLNPTMLTTGVGTANNGRAYYTAIKAFNTGVQSDNSITDYDYISWPSSGNNLKETFPADTPWSVTLNPNRYKTPNAEELTVTLIRENDGKSWTFDSNTGTTADADSDYFSVNTVGYGVSNCIIFRPAYREISSYVGNYQVTINGLKDRSGNETSLSYGVNFAPAESDIEQYDVTVDDAVQYTGSEVRPKVTVSAFSVNLIENKDYTVTYSNNIEPGTATATVKGIGNYSGTVKLEFRVVKEELVRFDANGGSGAPASVQVENGEMIIPNEIPILDRKNFVGWSEEQNAQTARYQPGDTVHTEKSITLYAVWNDPWELPEGETQTIQIIAPGTGAWFRFVPEYSCSYQIDLTGKSEIYLYTGSRSSSYSAGTDYGISTDDTFTADQVYEVYVRFVDETETGKIQFSLTLKHSGVVTKAATEPTCEEDGCTAEKTCSICGTVLEASEVIPATGHNYGAPTYTWSSDNSEVTAKAVCANDNNHVLTETVQTEYKVTKPATCAEAGSAEYTATFSNDLFQEQSKTIALDILRHVNAAPVKENEIIPTCTDGGSYDSVTYCSICGAELGREHITVPALGHDWGDWETVTGSTCNMAGQQVRVCKNDPSHKEYKNQALASHDLELTPEKAATCKEPGNIAYYTCSVCHEVFADENGVHAISINDTIIPVGDHVWDAGIVTTEPTTTEEGVKTYTCTVCGETKTESVPKLVTKAGWQKENGTWYFYNDDGTKATNVWKKDSQGWCWLQEDGRMLTNGWAKDSKGFCWIGEKGYMVEETRWIKVDGIWYHITNGYRDQSKWMKDSKGWCYVGPDGKMVTNGWARDSKGWCWMGADGYWVSSKWIQSGGQWYYIKSNHYMAANEWAKDSGGWMWMDANGHITKNKWIKSDGYWYYLKSNGYMATGIQKIGAKTYKFDSSGRWIS